jgi:hypothetical protein
MRSLVLAGTVATMLGITTIEVAEDKVEQGAEIMASIEDTFNLYASSIDSLVAEIQIGK